MGELAIQVKGLFKARGVVLPQRFDPGVIKAVRPGDPALQAGNMGKLATALFVSASPMAIHVDTASEVSKVFEQLIDGVCQALVTGWNSWARSVTFAGVVINATAGILPPGGMVGGPSMQGSLLAAQVPPSPKLPTGPAYASAILNVLGTAFCAWAQGYMHPALVFPGGALCVGSMPPSPCTPGPVAAGMSPGDAMMVAPLLKGQMMAMVSGNHAEVLFDAFAQAFVATFQRWKGATQINGILGAGGAASPLGSPVAGAVGTGGMLVGAPLT